MSSQKVLCFAVCALLLVISASAEPQQSIRVPRIGYLSGSSPSADAMRHEAFRQGLRELGAVEGETIVIEWRFAEGKLGRFSDLANDLVRLKVDLIVTGISGATRIAKGATNTIPIVMAQDSNPVETALSPALRVPAAMSQV